MKAADVMTSPAIAVTPDTTVAEAVRLMVAERVSGLPVVDAAGVLVGIVTEGDLLRRSELGTERRRPRWIEYLRTGRLAEEYARSHAYKVAEVMTERVEAVDAEASLADVVDLMERRRVKRVPVLRDGRLAGVVSRADLLQALAHLAAAVPGTAPGDAAIAERLRAELATQAWAPKGIKILVRNGVVELRGAIFENADRAALCVAAENVPGVTAVEDHLVWIEPLSGDAVLSDDDVAEA